MWNPTLSGIEVFALIAFAIFIFCKIVAFLYALAGLYDKFDDLDRRHQYLNRYTDGVARDVSKLLGRVDVLEKKPCVDKK